MKALISALVVACFLAPGIAKAACPDSDRYRTPGEVMDDLRTALAAQDWDDVACNYSSRAYVIDDQGILTGHLDIITAAQSLTALFSGVSPTVLQQDIFKDFVRVLYRLDAGWIVIPDGVSTYQIRSGKIRAQTSHGLIEFTGPPPP